MMDKSKPFGLVIPKRAKVFQAKTSVFDSDSDDEPVKKKKSTPIPQAKAPSKSVLAKKLCEDPSIFEYDSVYDEMKAKEISKITVPKDNKPSRYINTLLKAAEKRKKQHERRVEKKVQVEREKEGDEFKDKEAFVTSAYKKKMQEMEEEEERERRENMMNDMMDVTKQKDLSGFYRHFLKQSVGEENIPVFGEKRKIKEEVHSEDDGEEDPASKSEKKRKNEDKPVEKERNDSSETLKGRRDDSDKTDNVPKPDFNKVSKPSGVRAKMYRKGRSDSDDEDTHDSLTNAAESVDVPENLDQDSDIVSSDEEEATSLKSKESNLKNERSINISKSNSDSDASHDDKEDTHSKNKKSSTKSLKNIRKRTDDSDDSNASDSFKGDKRNSPTPQNENSEPISTETQNAAEGKKPKTKRNLFEKRTVGEVFTAAQARYFQRMAARG